MRGLKLLEVRMREMRIWNIQPALLCTILGMVIGIPADLFGGFALLVIGAVYLTGVSDLFSGKMEGVSFVLVGSILTGVFGILYILMMGADGLMYLLGEVRPEILLFLTAVPVIWYLNDKKWKVGMR